jgi:DNA-binding transcriptional MerR regulator
MPLKEKTIERMYWTISEVAQNLGVNTSLLRYWEKEFGSLRPKRTNRGDRLYTKDDIEHLRQIQHLVKDRGFTLQGAKGQLRDRSQPDEPAAPVPSLEELRDRLVVLREGLLALRGKE